MPIVAVAIKFGDLLYTLPKPNRHHHIIAHMLHDLRERAPVRGEQGFLTREGNFVCRYCAAKLMGIEGRKLYSEDLW